HGHACQHDCCHSCCHESVPESGCTASETSPCTCSRCDAESHSPAIFQGTATDDHSGSPCQPCPCSTGGCAHCSVAKVPCSLSGTLLGIPAPCFGQHPAEIPLLLPSAHRGELIRPPIA